MFSRLDSIRSKISSLAAKDTSFDIFGASIHQYELNPVKSESDLRNFEITHSITLPNEYRRFLAEIGNGGAGPFYGLEPLENSLFSDLDYQDAENLISPSKDFLLQQAWNMDLGDEEDEEKYEQNETVYFDPKWADGLLRVANFGCGISVNIVVTGKENGNIWIDDRCNKMGIYPEKSPETSGRIGFLDWYEFWLNKSLSETK